MASVVRRASLLVEFILHFFRFTIFEVGGSWIETRIRGKTKVTEIQRKPSTANEEAFLDICSFEAADEKSASFSGCGLDKGQCQTFGVGKTLPKKKKKKRFRKNKVSPNERIAWEKNEVKNVEGKKSRAPSLFTSRSSKASIMTSDFKKPCYKDKKDRGFSRATSCSQGEKKNIHIPGQPAADSSSGQNASQAEKSKSCETAQQPGPSWRFNENNVKDASSAFVNQKENLALPSGLRSKISFKWKGLRKKKRGKRVERFTGEFVAISDAKKEGLNLTSGFRSKVALKLNSFKKQAKSPKGRSNLQDSGVLHDSYVGCSNAEEHLHVHSGHPSETPFKWKFRGRKEQKKEKTRIGELYLGFQKLKKNLDRRTSLRSKISFKWRNLHGRKEDSLKKEESWTENQEIEPATTDMPGKSGTSELNENIQKASRLSNLLSRFKR